MIDLTTGIDLSSDHIQSVVVREEPSFLQLRDACVEYAANFPNMMLTLWSYIVAYRSFPTQKQFAEYFLHVHAAAVDMYDQAAVTARVFRAYPSLARELQFHALVQESDQFDAVLYSAQQDVKHGIDMQVLLGGNTYNISCYVQTKRALEFRNDKRTIRHKEKNNAIDLTLDLVAAKAINGWYFFDQAHVDILLNQVINVAWFNYRQHPLDLLK